VLVVIYTIIDWDTKNVYLSGLSKNMRSLSQLLDDYPPHHTIKKNITPFLSKTKLVSPISMKNVDDVGFDLCLDYYNFGGASRRQ